jgi:aspartyl-tRNA(Asn)/glutamyl-tRNA(Gln) amidotransferase subunit C
MAMNERKARVLEHAEVERIATLAHLGLTDAEKTAMAHELGKILSFVEQLSEVDLEGIAPTTQIVFDPKESPRADVVRGELDRDAVLAEAPRALDGGFSVPAFVDEG